MPNNLPHQLTSFVGRDQELVETRQLLHTVRLVTLTGIGGLGKTRMALQVASLAQTDYPDGVWLVELAALTDPKLVAQTVAAILGVREQPDKPIETTLTEHLQPRKLLLVLDNCEHLVEACARLAHALLRACPTLTILATSRQGLGIEGEACLLVPALTLPDATEAATPETLSGNDAVLLFLDRVHLRRGDFALTSENAATVASLCHKLDGIPLAIELAAARIQALSVEQIANRLDERFRLLASSSQTALPRHKTLEAMLDWSYSLLTEEERALFRALSVFAGGFSLDAIAEIDRSKSANLDSLETLTQLVDKSLVQVDQSGHEARYNMIETIREYAEQKASQSGELRDLREKHLAWCVYLAELTEDQLVSDRQSVWLMRLEQEHDNLRAALTFATGPHNTASNITTHLGLRLAGALVWFWYFRGYISEGRGWLEGALAAAGRDKRDVSLAKALSAAGVLGYLQGDLAAAQSRLEESLAIWRDLSDKRGTAFALAFLGRTLGEQGNPQGREYSEQSVELFRAIDDKWGLALSLDFLGEQAREAGEAERAANLHSESLTLYRELGHEWGVALELTYFAQVAFRQGEYTHARQRLEEAVKIQREVGDKRMLGWTLTNLGDVVRRGAGPSSAESLYHEALALFHEVGERSGIATVSQKLESIPEVIPTQSTPNGEQMDNLTGREVEVLRLLAGGLTDAQIAEQLVLSARTVQAHIRSIYSKLNISTRSAATRYAMEQGMG